MIGVIIFVVFMLIVGFAGWLTWYMYDRRKKRELKNIERGLKMVSLKIHLPPISDDTEGGGRDARDLVDENVSKAQTIYNIIASTLEKGNKRHIYGQRHFGFEIVASGGFVHFYAVVPLSLVDVVKQGVISAYPSARLDEVPEHNIFNKTGGINAVVGGEMVLKEPFAYPIATYQDMKRDSMQAFLNALSTLEKEDGLAVQILMRPADLSWRKTATSVSSKKRKGEDKKSGFGDYAKQLVFALSKPPEAKESKPGDISGLDQATIDSIDEKTRHAGYHTMIRVVASSNVYQRSQAILGNVVATFSLFDAPGRNGFKFEASDNMSDLVTGYIMRYFPQNRTKDLLNSVELATLFHFPDQRNIPTSQLERQGSKQVDGPRNVPDEGMLLGYNIFRGAKKAIRLAKMDRARHMYIVGQTGTGKSTALENLALQDMIDGNGFAFIDPHGDTAEKLLAMVPKERTEDIIYFSPADMDHPMGLNIFEFRNEDQKDFLIQEAIGMLYKLYDPQRQGIIGPRYESMFRNAALTVMAGPDGGTFIDIPKLFRDPDYVKQKLQYVTDRNVREFWEKEYPQSQRSSEFGEVVSWFVSKFGAFLSNTMMRNIIGQTKSAFDLRDVMDNKKILLVNLSKGRMGDLNSKLLGMIFVMKIQAAAMSRADIPEHERVDFALYVDEFQNFSTDSFATILSEARKYKLNLIVANQFTTQLTDEIRDAVFGNIGTIVAYRIGQNDVEALARYFQPTFDGDDLLRIPNHNAIVRTLIGGVPTSPFSLAALPPLGVTNDKLGDALKQLTAAKYGRPRKEVEDEIFARLATKEDSAGPAAPFGGANNSGSNQAGAAPRPAFSPAPSSQSQTPQASGGANGSFLDQWLQKRKAAAATPAQTSFKPTAAPVAAVPAPQVPPRQVATAPVPPPDPVLTSAANDSTNASLLEAGKRSVDAPVQAQGDIDISKDSSVEIVSNKRPQNISSSELEQQEIANIADELKQKLHMESEEATNDKTDDTDLDELAGLPKLPPVQTKVAQQQDEEDTIFIDPEGTLHIKRSEEDEEPESEKAS